jgi:hypothetical protein
MMYHCVLTNTVLECTSNETSCTGLYRFILLHTAECTNAEPPCTSMYWYIPRYTNFGIYGYALVCTFPQKYIRVCTCMYFSAKVYANLYYSIVQASTYTGIYRYILTCTRCRGFQMAAASIIAAPASEQPVPAVLPGCGGPAVRAPLQLATLMRLRRGAAAAVQPLAHTPGTHTCTLARAARLGKGRGVLAPAPRRGPPSAGQRPPHPNQPPPRSPAQAQPRTEAPPRRSGPAGRRAALPPPPPRGAGGTVMAQSSTWALWQRNSGSLPAWPAATATLAM